MSTKDVGQVPPTPPSRLAERLNKVILMDDHKTHIIAFFLEIVTQC